MLVKVEVQSPEEAERLLRQKEIQLGGKGRAVEEWFTKGKTNPEGNQRMTLMGLDAPKGPRFRVRSYANIAANTEDSLGWTVARERNNVGGTCRKCARTGHLERACPQRVKVKHFSCHGCGQFGHFISACPNKTVKGTGIFIQKGCYNCSKYDH